MVVFSEGLIRQIREIEVELCEIGLKNIRNLTVLPLHIHMHHFTLNFVKLIRILVLVKIYLSKYIAARLEFCRFKYSAL